MARLGFDPYFNTCFREESPDEPIGEVEDDREDD